MNENEDITCQNLWDLLKLVFRNKFTVVNTYIIKEERFHINKLNFHLRRLEEQTKAKTCRRKV